MKLAEIMEIYEGSNGDRTMQLYNALESRGPVGVVAMNLFRACKNSARAKKYRGGLPGKGTFKSMAYDRKVWAINNLATALQQHADSLKIQWGWGVDNAQSVHNIVLYVDLPSGQVSFHTAPRGAGPDYPGQWDGVRGMGPQRICSFCAQILGKVPA